MALGHVDDDSHQPDGMAGLAVESSRHLQTGMQSTLLCRCQAYFENFYKHRRRHSRGLVSKRRRKSVTINYRSIAVDANGYYVVDGLTVLPPSFSTCRKKRRMIEMKEEDERSKITGEERFMDEKYTAHASDDDASFSALPDEDEYRAMVGRAADDDYMETVIHSRAADETNQFVSMIEPSHERRIKGGAKGPKKTKGDVGGPKKAKAGPSPGWSGGGKKTGKMGGNSKGEAKGISPPGHPPNSKKKSGRMGVDDHSKGGGGGGRSSGVPCQSGQNGCVNGYITDNGSLFGKYVGGQKLNPGPPNMMMMKGGGKGGGGLPGPIRPNIFPCPDPKKSAYTQNPATIQSRVGYYSFPPTPAPAAASLQMAPIPATLPIPAPPVTLPPSSPPTTPPVAMQQTPKLEMGPLNTNSTTSSCGIDLSIDCRSSTGKLCHSLDYPSTTSCSGQASTLFLRYVLNKCDTSQNGQGSAASCVDLGVLDPSSEVMITCLGGAGKFMQVSPIFVSPGGIVAVSSNGQVATSFVNCTLTGGDGTVVQRVSIDVSGGSPLNLMDTFGALTIQGCDNVTCIEDAHYTYTLYNVDVYDMEMTKFDRTFSGATSSLLSSLPMNPIDSDAQTSFGETMRIDVCQTHRQFFVTSLSVHGIASGFSQGCDAQEYYRFIVKPPPSPAPTPASVAQNRVGTYFVGSANSPTISTSAKCELDVQTSCTTMTNGSCRDLAYPTANQCTYPIDTVIFRYAINTCDQSSNHQSSLGQCSDVAPFDASASVMITCHGSDGDELDVSPFIVAPGDVFSLADNIDAELPESIQCTISAANGNATQVVKIFTGNNTDGPIYLKDTFGALTVEGCDTVTCIEELHFTHSIYNAGSMGTDITNITRDFDGASKNLLEYLPINPLYPGETSSIEEIQMIDVCKSTAETYKTDITVSGVISGGGSSSACEVSDTYKFAVQA